jgi:hypothetical protein
MQCVKSAKDESYGPYRFCQFPRTRKVAETRPSAQRQRNVAETVLPAPDAVITVICAPDDG